MEDADRRKDDMRDVWGLVRGKDDKRLCEVAGLKEGGKLLEGRG